jgi:hypothetical protein
MSGYCEHCNNTGWLDCHCGGDLCVCDNNGEKPCFYCDGDQDDDGDYSHCTFCGAMSDQDHDPNCSSLKKEPNQQRTESP